MKKVRYFSLFLLAAYLMLTSRQVTQASEQVQEPLEVFEISARAAVLMDVSSGTVFYQKDAHLRLPPASTAKLMLGLVAVEAIEDGTVSADDIVTADGDERFDLTWDSTSVNIQRGESMRLEDLLYCALVASANEVCNMIAEHVAGGVPEFIEMMNNRAQELGCENTNFANAHGLPHLNNYSTAYDLALISREAVNHALLMQIVGVYSYTVPETNMSSSRTFKNTNYLLREETSQYYYPEATGLKTGASSDSGHCLLASAEDNNMHVVSAVLGAEAPEVEPQVFQVLSFIETKRMFQWFFDGFGYKDVLKSSELVRSIPVRLGKNTDSVLVHPEYGIRIIMPLGTDPELEFTRIINADDQNPVDAPIERGQTLGELVLERNGEQYAVVPLIANTKVDVDQVALLADRVFKTLNQTWIKITAAVIVVLFLLYLYAALRRSISIHQKRKARANKRPERVVYRDDDD